MYDMVTEECIESKKSEGQTSKQTNKQTNKRRQKDYSRRATIIKTQFSIDFSHYASPGCALTYLIIIILDYKYFISSCHNISHEL